MKHPTLAKYSDKALHDTLIKLYERKDLTEEESNRRGDMVIEELNSRGVDPIKDMADECIDLINKLDKKEGTQ